MSFRCIEYLTKLVLPVMRGQHQLHRPMITFLLSNNNVWERKIPSRQISTQTTSFPEKIGVFQKLGQKFKLQLKKYRLKAAGFQLYECVADHIDYISFMKELRMPDTFNSWFLITELHVWMLMSMLMGDPKYGRYLRNCVVQAMWDDVTARTKQLGPEQPSIIRSQIQVLSEEFQAALVNYDEGLLSSDTVLAGAIWRRLLQRDCDCTATDLEVMVKYIRKTMLHLDKWELEEFFKKKKLEWTPLSEIYADLPR